MFDLRALVKKLVTPLRQYLGRLTVIDRHLRGQGLEIGALQDPMPLPKGAVARYVDIVDDGETLATVADSSQDFVAANHFFEHCEDPIGTLRNLLRVVRPGGVVYLSLPDKRLMFDRDRPSTTFEHVVRDHEQGPAVSRQQHYEEVVRLGIKVEGETAIAEKVAELVQQDFRIHFHCWSQTDFLQFLCALQARAGFPRFDIAEFVANEREMVVVLRRSADG